MGQPGNVTIAPTQPPGNYFLNRRRAVRRYSHELVSHPVGQGLISTYLPPPMLTLVKFLVYSETWFRIVLVLKLTMGGEHYRSIQVKVKEIYVLTKEQTMHLVRSLLRMKNRGV